MCLGQCGPVQTGAGGHVPVGGVHLLRILLPRARHRFNADPAGPGSSVWVQLGCQGILRAPVLNWGRACRRGSSSHLQCAVAGYWRGSSKRVGSHHAASRGGQAFEQRVRIQCLIPNGFWSGLRSHWLQAHANWSSCKTVNRRSCSTLAASSLPWKTVARMRVLPWREARVLSTSSVALHTACDLTFATASAPRLRACVSAPMKSLRRTSNSGYVRQNSINENSLKQGNGFCGGSSCFQRNSWSCVPWRKRSLADAAKKCWKAARVPLARKRPVEVVAAC